MARRVVRIRLGLASTVVVALLFLVLRDRSTESRNEGRSLDSTDSADPRRLTTEPRVSIKEAAEEAAATKFRVTVVNAAGGPEAGAIVSVINSVSARYAGESPLVTALTDGAGEAMCEVPGGWRRLRVWAESADCQRAPSKAVETKAGHGVTLRLLPAATVQGRVVGCQRAAYTSVRVRAYCGAWPESPNVRILPVNVEGAFQVCGVRGFLSIMATAPDHTPSRIWSGRVSGPKAGIELRVTPGATTALVILRDGNQDPLPSGTVVRYQQEEKGALAASVGGNGELLLSCLDPLLSTDVYPEPTFDAQAGRWKTTRCRLNVQPDEYASRPLLTVPNAIWASFRIIDSRGEPVPSLNVLIVMTSNGAPYHKHAAAGAPVYKHGVTDAEGRWSPFSKLTQPSSRCELLVNGKREWSRNLRGHVDALQTVRLGQPWTTVRVALLDWAGNPIRSSNVLVALVDDGIVVNQAGAQRWTAGVQHRSFRGASTVTLATKSSRLGDAWLSVVESGHIERRFPLGRNADKNVQRVALSQGAGAVRFVVRAGDGRGVDGAKITLSAPRSKCSARTENGRATVYGLAPGKYQWRTSGGQDGADVSGVVTVAAGSVVEVIIDPQ